MIRNNSFFGGFSDYLGACFLLFLLKNIQFLTDFNNMFSFQNSLQLNGNVAESQYRCCWRSGNNNPKCDNRKPLKSKESFHCIMDVTSGSALSAYIEDCDGRRSNELQLNVQCKEPSVKIKEVKHKGKDYFMIEFDKTVVKLVDSVCEQFIKVTT